MVEQPTSFWDNHKFLSWLKNNHDWLLGWIIGITITAAISSIVTYLIQNNEWVWVVISFIFVSLTLGFVVLGNYYSQRFRELFQLSDNLGHSINYYRQLLCDQGSVAQDVTLKSLTKRIIFDKESLNHQGNCQSGCEWFIQNNMEKEGYNKLFFYVQSFKYVPPFEHFSFYKNGKKMPIDKISTKFENI